MLNPCSDSGLGCGEDTLDEIGAGLVDEVHQSAGVLTDVGEPQLDARRGQEPVDQGSVDAQTGVGVEIPEMHAAAVLVLPVQPGPCDQVVEDFNEPVKGFLIPALRPQRPQVRAVESLLQRRSELATAAVVLGVPVGASLAEIPVQVAAGLQRADEVGELLAGVPAGRWRSPVARCGVASGPVGARRGIPAYLVKVVQ